MLTAAYDVLAAAAHRGTVHDAIALLALMAIGPAAVPAAHVFEGDLLEDRLDVTALQKVDLCKGLFVCTSRES